MIDSVLALIDGSCASDAPANAATELAVETNAELILAVDPRHEAFSALAARMSRLVEHAVYRGARTSTILVDLEEPAAILRLVRQHRVGVVTLESEPHSQLADLLRNANVEALLLPIPELAVTRC